MMVDVFSFPVETLCWRFVRRVRVRKT